MKMSKLVIHKHLGRINEGVRYNGEVLYKQSTDRIWFIDTFFIKENRGKQSISFIGAV